MFWLKDRSIIEISGSDKEDFLQGIITNDIKLLKSQKLIYSAFLNASGRFLADFFIFESGEKYLLDCNVAEVDDIIKKFNFYKLRSKVDVKKNEDLQVIFNMRGLGFVDSRAENFGSRFYVNFDEIDKYQPENLALYHQRRIDFRIPEGVYDLAKEKSFIAEYDFDKLNAVSYQKGCYVGQETTARNHYRGLVRKKICGFEITNINDDLMDFINSSQHLNSSFSTDRSFLDLSAQINDLQIDDQQLESAGFTKFIPAINLEINLKTISANENPDLANSNSKEIGIILSAIFNQKSRLLKGLALIKIDEYQDHSSSNFSVLGNQILILN